MSAPTRRVFLGAALPGLLKAQSEPTSELKRFRDPATEFEIWRYTDPTHSSWLAPAHLRSISGRNFLVFCSDRSGSRQLWRLDLKSGEMRQLTTIARDVDPKYFALLPDERLVCFLTDETLELSGVAARARTLHQSAAGWRPIEFALTDDARGCFVLEQGKSGTLLRQIGIQRRTVETRYESREPLAMLRPRPRGPALLFRRGERLVLLGTAREPLELATPRGRIRQAVWSADGRSVHYLLEPEEPGKLITLRECFPDSGDDKLIAPTSQFVNFARNSDSSVFVGLSASRGSPYILILLRITKRELTVAEHRTSSPADTVILFSPDSQRIFYNTDRHGKPAIYALPAERLIERTEVSAQRLPIATGSA